MGTACSEDSSKFNTDFAIDMQDARDESLQQNYRENKSDVPSSRFARKSEQRPRLFPAVAATRAQQLQQKHLRNTEQKGIALPIFYIPSKRGYYEGQWNNGHPHGYGKFYFNNGMYYEGQFRRGQATGEDCLLIYPDGSYKRGQMVDGKMQGKGTFFYKINSLQYDGNWIKDKPYGKGIQKYMDGGSYEGQFVNGKKQDDDGVFKWKNGKVYKGAFKDGYMNGYGVLKMANGKGYYEGQFQNNLIKDNTNGKMKTETGEYEGNFQNGKMHGYGVFKWYDKKVYEGNFKAGKLHGQGTLFYPNGQKVSGQWFNGQNTSLNEIATGKSTIK